MEFSKLEIKTLQTFDGKFNVSYAYLNAPYNEQVVTFLTNGLNMPSPAQVRYMQAFNEDQSILNYSRTEMDVVNMPEVGKIALVARGIISRIYGTPKNIVNAHKKENEWMIVQKEDSTGKNELYNTLNGLEKIGYALTVEPGKKELPTDKFEEIPEAMFLHGSKQNIRIDAKMIGGWLKGEEFNNITLYLDDADYMKSQGGIYVNKILAGGAGVNFDISGGNGHNLNDDGGAFGVNFVPAP